MKEGMKFIMDFYAYSLIIISILSYGIFKRLLKQKHKNKTAENIVSKSK